MTETHDEDMPDEIDFSNGVRGKLYRPATKLNLPVYLDSEVRARLAALASDKGVDVSVLVNDLIRKDIELIEMARQSAALEPGLKRYGVHPMRYKARTGPIHSPGAVNGGGGGSGRPLALISERLSGHHPLYDRGG